MVIKTPKYRKIFPTAINYINIFQSKALKIYPNWNFLFENKPSGNPATFAP
jgi:hypothetical protein